MKESGKEDLTFSGELNVSADSTELREKNSVQLSVFSV